MALSTNDKEWITSTFKTTLLESLQPIQTELERHSQTLYGINRDDGLVKEIEELKVCQATSKAKMWKFVGIASGAWLGLFGALSLAAKLIFHW